MNGALVAPPVFVFVMFVVGADNAWDLLLDRYRKRSFLDVGAPSLTDPEGGKDHVNGS